MPIERRYPHQRAGSPDNFQTDPAALDCLLPFIPKKVEGPFNSFRPYKIWEPACGNGNLTKAFSERGYDWVGTDILTGCDFMEGAPPVEWDCIITNPPFSIKEKFLGRCYNLGKPFALLLPISVFDSVERRSLFKQFHTEFIFPPRRINFETPNHEANQAAGKKTSAWFYSIWVCYGLNIGRQLTFTD